MTEQAQLPEMMAKARELYAWHLALQEAGFPELQAFSLLQTLVLTGQVGRD